MDGGGMRVRRGERMRTSHIPIPGHRTSVSLSVPPHIFSSSSVVSLSVPLNEGISKMNMCLVSEQASLPAAAAGTSHA